LPILTFHLILGAAVPALAQQDQSVECVKRSAAATPPPFPAVPPPKVVGQSGGGRPDADQTAARARAVCADTDVPVIREIRPERPGYGKGNPLLRPGAPPSVPGAPQHRGALTPGPFRSFAEVYGTRRGQRPRLHNLPPSPGQPACDGIWQDGACYYYGSAALQRVADGGGMTMSVKRPNYDNSGGAGHSLDEIAVQGGTGNGNIVELGWLVSSDMNGDADPHIFVFHWVDGTPSCYNGCGWQQWSSIYFPGQNISKILDRDVYAGYVFWQNNWWAWFDDQWLGYFPGSLWSSGYSRNAIIQWFGEIASLNGIPPKTQMGDGIFPPPPLAANNFTLCDVDANVWACWIRDQQNVALPTNANYYRINRVNFGNARYGGPGS
jgi:hypothetical protein